ncbi:hypothetical protein EB796_014937 [Bugula neritina]|uniref:Protein kinase domain-containing protein n=1 Tax=Bugula neritina TaxID=10212 RepID=A0A7J7JMA8_BUGNE|nr:hypothetical protein EB796_014937 [Bugula neritina]
MRTCSDSQPTEHLTSVDGQQTSVAVVGAADEQGEHHLDIVREESGEIAAGADDMVKSDLMFQRMTPVVDTTFYQPPELTDAMLNTTVFIDPSNPFSESVQAKVLRKVDITSYENVEVRKDAMPKLKVGSQVTVSNLTVKLMSKLGVGGFAVAYKAIVTSADRSTSLGKFSMCNTLDSTAFSESDDVCVKAQKPSCPWELYVCKELRQRVSCMDEDIERDIGSKLMDITHSVFFSDGSLMVNELVPLGSLLNLVNSMKANSCKIPESLVMYVTIELLHAVEVMHRCKIIHGDIKPDNILFCGL